MKRRLIFYKKQLVVCLFTILAFGCVSGEKGDPDLPETVEVGLQVGISDVSQSPLMKASGKDKHALDGEQIHSLVVFIVNTSGTVEKKLLPDLSNDMKANTGELESWTSGTFTLTGGTKQIYALANWESLNDTVLNAKIGTEEGQMMPELLSKTVSWPAEGFDPQTGKYLPMSMSAVWTAASGKKTIELVRLVSRLQVKVTNATNHSVQLDKLDVYTSNEVTNLFEKSSIYSPPGGLTTNSFLAASGEIKKLEPMTDTLTNEYTSAWVYVFESDTKEKGFKLDFRTTSSGADMNHDAGMHGGERHTLNKVIKRNHIWKLNLWISGYTLTLTLKGENPPIGGYPAITTTAEGASCTVYGGGPFSIKIGDLKSQENAPVPEITEWKISGFTDGDESLLVGKTIGDKLSLSDKTITGRMVSAATEDASVTFKLEAISQGQTVSVFPIKLIFEDIFSPSRQP